MQVDRNTSVENTMLQPIINGKVLNRHALSVTYVLEWHSSYSSNVSYMKCHSIAQCKDVESCGGADNGRIAKLTYLQCKLNIDSSRHQLDVSEEMLLHSVLPLGIVYD